MINALLYDYSRELGLINDLTLEDVINAHRHLRELNKRKNAEWLEELDRARKLGYDEGLRLISNSGDYIKASELKEMKVSDLVNILYD